MLIPSDLPPSQQRTALRQVETAFFASTAVLLWILSFTPLAPLLRLFFPIPVALAVLRWDQRTGSMTLVVSTVLLTLLLGPTRSVLYLIPYGLLGWWCGGLWRRGRSWYRSILDGSVITTVGLMFQLILSSLLVGENLWAYITIQITAVTNWILDFGLSWLGIYLASPLWLVQVGVVLFVALNSLIYVFTVHLVASMVMERLKCPLPLPPPWILVLLN